MDCSSAIHRFMSNVAYQTYAPILDRLTAIFATMDKAYQEAADYYRFYCTGCRDSCCLTRFYHHTVLEYCFVLEGYKGLDRRKQVEVEQRAWDVCRKTDEADQKGATLRLMCPLNVRGLCMIYDFRPMICRLHGIPHELHRPDGSMIKGDGCDTFYQQCFPEKPFMLDRTPFYVAMADLESELRQTAGIQGKVKMTIAQMIVSYEM